MAINVDADSNNALDIGYGGTGSQLTDPGADRILFWDDSAAAGSNTTWLAPGTGLSITATTLNVTWPIAFTSDYSSDFDAAVVAIGATETTLYVNDAAAMSTNVTTPATLSVVVLKGGSIDQDVNTLTINGPFSAGFFEVFVGSGTVAFGRGSIQSVSPHWWFSGSGDYTAAMTSAQNALPSSANTYGGGIVDIPSGDYTVNDFEPKSGVKYQGAGERLTRLVGTTSNVITGTASREYCIFENIGFVTINTKSGVDTDGNSYGHFTFRNCNFEGPSKYGLKGYLILSLIDHCSFGYFPSDEKIADNAIYLDTAANANRIQFCKFYRCVGAAIKIADHAYSNIIDTCDFETLDDKAMELVQGNSTVIMNCWFENLNIVTNSENCVIEFGVGNAGVNTVINCRLSGTKNYTASFFYIGANEPQIRFENNDISDSYTNLDIITLTASDKFWYYNNNIVATGVTITDGGYAYYSETVKTGSISCMGFKGMALSGTWALTYSSYLPSLTRTSNNNTEEYYLFEVPLPLIHSPVEKGIRIDSVTVVYAVANGDAGDDFSVVIRTRVAPADNSAPAAVASLSGTFDAAHDSAAKRSNSAGGHADNTMVKTTTSAAWLDTANTTVVITLIATEADDATGALAIVVKDVILGVSYAVE